MLLITDTQKVITMKIYNRRKVIGIAFSVVALVLLLGVLTPALGIKNKTISSLPTYGYGYGYGYGCDPFTPGYWKNHPANWPVESITIGGTSYTKAEAISLMKAPTHGDKTYNMFEHLVAAKLNVLMGCESSCIDDVIEDADAWMEIHPVGSGVDASSQAWDEGEPLFEMLDDYNNGNLC